MSPTDDVVSAVEIECTVNGETVSTTVEPHWTLLDLLREEFDLTGTTEGCRVGVCGCCTVVVDGEPINSCLELAVNADAASITTIEGLGSEDDLDPVQEAYREEEGFQCGYCTSGMIMMTKSLLEEDDVSPTDDEQVKRYMSENLCRCTGYASITDAIETAYEKARTDGGG